MSWPTWSAATAPIPTAVATSVQSTLLPTALNSAPAVLAPMGYSQEQWAQAQQQNWQQWAQWQQQYQQWHQQYGAEYQKSLNAMQGAMPAPVQVQPPLPAMTAAVTAPPLPTDNKPPLPPDEPPLQAQTLAGMPTYPSTPSGYSTTAAPPLMPQNFPLPNQMTMASLYQSQHQAQTWQTQNQAQKRPHGQDIDYDQAKRAMVDKTTNQWNQQKPQQSQWQQAPNQNFNQPPPVAQQQPQQAQQPAQAAAAVAKGVEELSEAEKKFDKEFAAWEAQFNRWKEQNANHPDKTQYREYEKKWESWRNSLLERREQMRRKRLALTGQAVTPAPAQKPQSQPPVTNQAMANASPTAAQPHPANKPSLLGAFPGDTSMVQQGELFDKPPPNQNNEPLAFKNKPSFPESSPTAGEGFLASGASSGGIPGLDLVKDDGKEDLPDRSETVEKVENVVETPQQKGPDLEAISKGINSILGDQKLLSMLSMVSQTAPPSGPLANVATDTPSNVENYSQNFGMPPPNFQQQYPVNNFGAPPPMFDLPNQNQNKPNKEDYYQQQRFDGPPPDLRNNFSTAPPSFVGRNAPMDQFSRGPVHAAAKVPGENFSRGPVENFAKSPGDNLNRGPIADFTRGLGDNFNRGPINNFARGLTDNFARGPTDNFARGPTDNLARGPTDNLARGPTDNLARGPTDNLARGPGDTFNRGPIDKLARGPGDTFNRGPTDIFTRGAGDNFNKDTADSFNKGPADNFARSSGDNFSRGSGDKFGRDSGENFGRGSGDNFGGGSGDNFARKSDSFPLGLGDSFSRGAGDNFGKGPRDNFTKGAGNFGDKFNQFEGGFRGRNENVRNSRFDNEDDGNRKKNYNRDKFGGNKFGRTDSFNRSHELDEDFDTYNDEEDYDKYNDMFRDDEDDQYQDNDHYRDNNDKYDNNYQQQQNQPRPLMSQPIQQPKIPSLMDLTPAPPQIQPLIPIEPPAPVDDVIFEPVTVIDYDHQSKANNDEVYVVPNNMYDYNHKPINCIPHTERPKWLAETVKFIREFDPEVVRYERVPSVPDKRFSDPIRDDSQHGRFEGRDRYRRERSFDNDDYRIDKTRDTRGPRDRGSRDGRESRGRDRSRGSREDRFRSGDRDNFRNENSDRQRFSGDKNGNNTKNNIPTKDFEELSDNEMDFEQTEQARHQQVFETRSKSRSPELSNPPNPSVKQIEITMIEDIINAPGRFNRPPRIVIILRGPPGSGKTFLAKQIKDKEVENGGSAPRILSLDDYFMVEHEKKVMEDGKMQMVKEMVYEYEAEMEESYRQSFMKSFKKTITDGYFPFIIVDNVNDKVKYFGEMWSFAKQNGFQVYVCQMDLDPVQCTKRNVHNRSEKEIEDIIAAWEPTPAHHPTIDASGLLQMCAIADVEMEVEEQPKEPMPEEAEKEPEDQVRSKWDNFDCSNNNLAKLDGVYKPLRKSGTMEEYLQLEDEWQPPRPQQPGKKRVRWADLEEQRSVEKMRAIGFVVGQTDWDKMMDPTAAGNRALTQTKYIEKVSRIKY